LVLDGNGSGTCQSYYKSGSVKEEIAIVNWENHGICKSFFEDGQVHRVTNFKEGREYDVISTFNYTGDSLFGGTLKDGNGTLVRFHYPKKPNNDSLLVSDIFTFENTKINGEFIRYNTNGGVSQRGWHKNGIRSGEFTTYKSDGSISYKLFYEEKFTVLTSEKSSAFYSENSFANEGSEPVFQGGETFMNSFIKSNVTYPMGAISKNISGKVYVQIILNEIGEILRYRTISDTPIILNDEAKRVITLMPRWKPTLNNGVPSDCHEKSNQHHNP
jgi:antitoxin component YwqK of YwqJK toxin-antitoxin module